METDVVLSRSALDERLLANARKSLREISEITGLGVDELAERYSVLFEERGWLTERQEERLLLIELGDMLTDGKERLKQASLEDYASIYRAILANMTLMANRMDMRRKLVDDDINRITHANARQFGAAYDTAVNHIVASLRAAHPDITDEEIEQYSTEGLKKARNQLAKVTL